MPQKPKRFFNSHAHSFTDDHVPEYFLSKWLPISKLLSKKWLIKFMHRSAFSGDLGFWGTLIVKLLHVFDKNITKGLALRYMNFFVYDNVKKQADVIAEIQQYYPKGTGLALMTMDMEYMGAGKPKTLLREQLAELEQLKNSMPGIIYPFVHCDPRRIAPRHARETDVEKVFTGQTFLNAVFDYLQNKIYQGIKIYPALGYYPFEERMMDIYKFALQYNIPVLSHCIVGAVHFKFVLGEEERYHPFLKKTFPVQQPALYQYNFTHPLNFECFLNKDLLRTVWKEAPDFFNLKICLAHWGGEDEWHQYIGNAWSDIQYQFKDAEYPALDIRNWVVEPGSPYKNFSWFSVICSMIRKYPNVYADISYTLEDATLLPLLKATLEGDEKIRSHVLFGTDFFLVSRSISEREFGINARAYLGNALFDQIARINALEFLSTQLNPVLDR